MGYGGVAQIGFAVYACCRSLRAGDFLAGWHGGSPASRLLHSLQNVRADLGNRPLCFRTSRASGGRGRVKAVVASHQPTASRRSDHGCEQQTADALLLDAPGNIILLISVPLG